MGPHGYPIWPLMALLVAALAVAEGLPLALGVAAQATLLALADALRPLVPPLLPGRRTPSTRGRCWPPPSATSRWRSP